jgi:hypothetical protein
MLGHEIRIILSKKKKHRSMKPILQIIIINQCHVMRYVMR